MARRIPGNIHTVEKLPTLLVVAEVEELFNASRPWVFERIADGDFKSLKADGKRFITATSVLAYIERKKSEKTTRDERVTNMLAGRQAKRAARAQAKSK